jgi:hypothetical protein
MMAGATEVGEDVGVGATSLLHRVGEDGEALAAQMAGRQDSVLIGGPCQTGNDWLQA